MRSKKIYFWIGSTLLVVMVGILFALSVEEQPLHAPLPGENAYDDFVRASDSLRGNPNSKWFIGEPALMTGQERSSVQSFLRQNQESLRYIEEGVQNDCVIPVVRTNGFSNTFLSHTKNFKRLGGLLETAGLLAEMDGDYEKAVHHYSTGLLFGAKLSNGLLIGRTTAVLVMGEHMDRLKAIAPKLDRAAATEALQVIEGALEIPESAEETVERDMGLFRAQWQRGIGPMIRGILHELKHDPWETGLQSLRKKLARQRQESAETQTALKHRLKELGSR